MGHGALRVNFQMRFFLISFLMQEANLSIGCFCSASPSISRISEACRTILRDHFCHKSGQLCLYNTIFSFDFSGKLHSLLSLQLARILDRILTLHQNLSANFLSSCWNPWNFWSVEFLVRTVHFFFGMWPFSTPIQALAWKEIIRSMQFLNVFTRFKLSSQLY